MLQLPNATAQKQFRSSARPAALPPAIRFGSVELTGAFVLSSVSEVLMSKALHSLLDGLSAYPLPVLKQQPQFEYAKLQLELAQKVADADNPQAPAHQDTVIEYLNEAERSFASASTQVSPSALKAECLQYAARCAQLAGRPKEITRHYAAQALAHHQKAGPEIRAMIQEKHLGLQVLKVLALWPVVYPLICATAAYQKRSLPEVTQKLLFPENPQQVAVLNMWQHHRQSDLPAYCKGLLSGSC